MKLNKFLLSAIAAASLTACSDSTDVVNNNKGHWNADGTGYVCLSISMPDNVASKGSRANDDFVKGDDNEYAVKNATLVIFSGNGTDEGAYTMEAAYELPLKFQTTGTNGQQIISTAKITQKINEIGNAEAKALVILNLPSNLHLADNDLIYGADVNTGQSLKNSNTTFAQFQALESTLNVDVTNGFTMTNAPLTTGHSSTTAPTTAPTTTLATITKDNIKPTAEEAAQNPAAYIYVERSVAKVTVTSDPTNYTGTIETNNNIHINFAGYDLDNTNTTSYIVRNADETSNSWYNLKSNSSLVNGEDQYRFIGYTPVDENNTYYRTYWAKDPNYNNTSTAIKYDSSTDNKRFSTIGQDHPKYCMENTFDVEHQTQENTTRAILRVQMYKDGEAPGTTYYMYNNDATTFANWDDFRTAAITAANKLTTVLANNKTVTNLELEDATDEHGNVIKGFQQIKNVTIDGTIVNSDEVFESIKKYFGEIAKYDNGYAYYTVLIKHFGDDLTPWNTWETTDKPAVGNIYPNYSEANYLGRYGVVRNNWYNINVKKVLRPGTPTINPPSTNTDDELESYISVSINILSWAKRSQDVDLQ